MSLVYSRRLARGRGEIGRRARLRIWCREAGWPRAAMRFDNTMPQAWCGVQVPLSAPSYAVGFGWLAPPQGSRSLTPQDALRSSWSERRRAFASAR